MLAFYHLAGRKDVDNEKRVKRLLWLDEVDKDSLPEVGGKNASLGELLCAGMRVPPGFAVTTECVFDAEIRRHSI